MARKSKTTIDPTALMTIQPPQMPVVKRGPRGKYKPRIPKV
jgi:hypothetical protein